MTIIQLRARAAINKSICYLNNNPMFTIEFWNELLFDVQRASQISGHLIGGIISGSFTLFAAFISLYVYFSRKSRQSTQDFLKWLADTNIKFERNESYQTTRESLAQNRPILLLYVALELYLSPTIELNKNSAFSKKGIEEFLLNTFSASYNILEFDKNLPFKYLEYSKDSVENWKFEFNWTFIRKFTDYKRFYEESLIACEELANINDGDKASTLINLYIWHIRSLIFGWGNDFYNKLFIQFLLHNHLDRLVEVSIYMLGTKDKEFTDNLIYLNDKISIKNQKRKSMNYKSIRKKWKNMIKIPSIYSGGVITPEILNFSKRSSTQQEPR